VFSEGFVLTAVNSEKDKTYEFGPFCLNASERLLLRDGKPVPLAPKVFDTLVVLVENGSRLVSKDDLMSTLWPDTFVEEGTLTRNISDLRKTLGESAGGERYIETVPRHGYRFVAPLKQLSGEAPPLIVEKHSRSRIVALEHHEKDSWTDNDVESVDWINQPIAKTSARNHLAAQPGAIQDSTLTSANTAVVAPASAGRVARPKHRVALLTVTAAAAVIALAVASVIIYRRAVAPAASTTPIRSIAVLPLENLSGDPAQEYFADGMTEAFISNLAQIRALKVISRTSVMRYKGVRRPLTEVARELNVDAVIEGSVQRSGGRVRVTAQLIHAATDVHLWAREYERDLTDVLKLQSEVARAVAAEIRVQVTPDERERLAYAPSIDPQAHEAYLLGRHHLSKTNAQDRKRAVEYFEKAIQISGDYAAAYAGLSSAWVQRGIFEAKDFKEVEAAAREAALRAIGLDDQIAEAHTALADIKYEFDWDWKGADEEMKRALELNPGSHDVHLDYGHLLMALGRHDEAIREGRSAEQLDPVSSRTQSALGRFLYRARKYEEAVPHLERAVDLEPRNVQAHSRLAEVYAQLGRYSESISHFEKIRELTGENGNPNAGLARVYAMMGRKREARQLLNGLKAQSIIIAPAFVALGDKDEAFRILGKAVDEHNSFLVYLKEDPPFDDLHSDPRWKVLLRRMNFPQD
jgi:TolB-like protein/DNA-binding winged helix-turn-helix (wHTH) protein/Tfp pilus assembly protein PilF